ncbi:hypothetical protein [aff. Roholtiella sp. LEGE 12411]|uniref:hypothetical protein n=1 Tax=aff. Roholtiella sp. LEGE 12411 TaxID=1828822 RepID=UPI00187E715E|nr:hypothetical protein [aff. Roholtiella sp. LEGE 12411]
MDNQPRIFLILLARNFLVTLVRWATNCVQSLKSKLSQNSYEQQEVTIGYKHQHDRTVAGARITIVDTIQKFSSHQFQP